ncbi:hypothetical protein CANINC_002049 [Pichia inconspicua]|uniref:Eukaryotic translation initiation factor 3 subunit E N-terminal domain-containing protein n=1 Tax=Pichia inconspicua TaxID=52247 RepID=A0A4T0X229_9ASCO|nr:hypothetical protein CANINC_002049 [[Candida] inconspicua]
MSALTEEQKDVAKKYDLTGTLTQFVDRHLLYPLLENSVCIYPANVIDQLEFDVLKDTYMLKSLQEIYHNIHPDEKDLPQEFATREKEIMDKLVPLNESTKKTLEILCSPEVQQHLKQDKISNRELIKAHGIDDAKILELYEFGKLQYNRGDYVMASDLLNNFKLLSTDQTLVQKAVCGKLVSDIMSGDVDEAKEELNKLREIIDNKTFTGTSIEQLKLRNWMIHNSLFIYFSEKELTDPSHLSTMNELFMSSSYSSTIEASSPWILRYIIASILYTKDFRRLKDIAKAVEIESYEYQDPFTTLINVLTTSFEFHRLASIIEEIKIVAETDFFLNHLNKDILLANIYELSIKNILKVYKTATAKDLQKFIGNVEIPDEFLVVKNDKSDDLYFQTYEKTKALSFKSSQFLSNAFD